jgi:hypothetical protein
MSHYLKKCLCCESRNLATVLNLNNQPLANSYAPADQQLDVYPLAVNMCEKCFHMQLSYIVDPDLMFKNYLYVSGTTQTLRDYFDWFALKLKNENPNSKTVLDIACNDGSQLNSFKNLGFETYGIDPAENLLERSVKNGHNILCDYFNKDSVGKLKSQFKVEKIDVITAQNVFAHNDNPYEFLLTCKELMHDDSSLYIQTSQATMVENNQFDTIYHEHVSFFNVNSMKTLVERSGLYLNHVEITSVHGNSYVFKIGKSKNSDRTVEERMLYEKPLFDKETYFKYSRFCKDICQDLKTEIKKYREEGYVVAGYGAAAKGVVLINFAKIDLDFVVDDNSLKHNLCMPGTKTLIYSPLHLKEFSDRKMVLLPLAWNFFEEIKQKVNLIVGDNKVVFLKYFPKVEAC